MVIDEIRRFRLFFAFIKQLMRCFGRRSVRPTKAQNIVEQTRVCHFCAQYLKWSENRPWKPNKNQFFFRPINKPTFISNTPNVFFLLSLPSDLLAVSRFRLLNVNATQSILFNLAKSSISHSLFLTLMNLTRTFSIIKTWSTGST